MAQLFQDHCTVAPTAIVLVDGLKELLVTEMPPAGGGVFPGGGLLLAGGGLVEPPPPPHAQSDATASATKTDFIENRLPGAAVPGEATEAMKRLQGF